MNISSKQPANKWSEGYPLGNGHMGAMISSGNLVSRIDLSENTFYSGEKSSNNNQKDAEKAFYKMREHAIIGDYEKVHKIAEKFIGIRKNYGTNLPVGYLQIDYGTSPEEVSNYERNLNIMDGIADCTFSIGQDTVKEEVFVSHPDNIMIYHLVFRENRKIKITFNPGNSFGDTEYRENSLQFTCYAYETKHCDELSGVMLAGYGHVITDGICDTALDGLYISNARDIRLYFYMNTDFKREFSSKEIGRIKLKEEVKEQVKVCMDKEFAKIRDEHIKDIRKLMERVHLKLSGKDSLVEKIPLLFQYGRYLLLSSSRNDSRLPAHLQGIWNDNVACRIGWTCDMHLDINTQMNYWPAEITNLTETVEPLIDWIKDDLSLSGEITAKESYGLSGWVGELVSNAWGYAAPYWASPIAPCPTGGIWVLMQLWERYLFTEDEEFLRNTAFPLIQSAAVFFNQYIFQDDKTGWFTSGPSISPENSFLYKDKAFQISNGCTYEILMIRELFQVYLASCSILQLENSGLFKEVSEKLPKLMPYRITKEGTIAEWSHMLPPVDPQHRHTSHLLGLFPFSQLTLEETPELCEAAKKTIDGKLIPEENWEDTGWARSMLILYEARLSNGNDAYLHIKSMTSHLLEPNKLVYHPPTRGAYAFDHVYELDGNTGLTTSIAEMLLQSHNGILRLLPALPEVWETGSVTGLLARGNITVDLFWEKGQLKFAKLLSKKDRKCQVSYKGVKQEINLIKGIPYIFS